MRFSFLVLRSFFARRSFTAGAKAAILSEAAETRNAKRVKTRSFCGHHGIWFVHNDLHAPRCQWGTIDRPNFNLAHSLKEGA